MAKQSLLWTVIPHGRVQVGSGAEHRLRVSAVLSPRLTPEAANEQALGAFPEFLDWPAQLTGAEFGLRVSGQTLRLRPLTKPDSDLWEKLFDATTPVAGFVFKDMSQVNLHSYPVKNVLGYLRRHYNQLAAQSASDHPTLLPWKAAQPNLKDMLEDIGTKTLTYDFGDRSIEVALPGFSRFFGDDDNSTQDRLTNQVFGRKSVYGVSVPSIGAGDGALPSTSQQARRRTMSPDWYNPRPGGPGSPLVAEPDAALMNQFSSNAEYSLYQANRFYKREAASAAQKKMRYPSFQNVPDAPEIPEYDFHRIVASYGSYPLLLRALGLIIDFAVEPVPPGTALALGPGITFGNMALGVKWTNGHNDSNDGYPKTAWHLERDRYVPRPRGTDLDRGLLRLENSNDNWGVNPDKKNGLFDLYQVDPDGASLKTVGFTLTAQNLVTKSLHPVRADGQVTYTTGDRQPVAALRTGGLGVSRHGRAGQVATDAAAAALKNQAVETGNSNNIVFFAEDLQRGYRVDVAPVPNETDPGRWHSLCARLGEYHLIKANEDISFSGDEGHVSGASATSGDSDGTNPDDYYLHESLFRWTGWSLAAPRPGKAIKATNIEGTELQGETPADITDQAEKGNGLAVQYTVPKGSLPKLRFGQLYRMRARYVDVAGNSLDLNDPTLGEKEQASDAVGYWRFEPIDPPVMVGRGRLSEGESLERMVIRSNFDVMPEDYLQTSDFAMAIAQPASADFDYTARNERHLVPPKASQQQCEMHGLFDPYFGDWEEIKKGYEIAAREDGTLFDDTPGAQVDLITPAALGNIATTTANPPALPTSENPVGDRLAGGQYIIHREAQLQPTYLPDGASAGISLRAMPGHSIPGIINDDPIAPGCAVVKLDTGEFVILVPHANDWPDSEGFRLILAERQAALADPPCKETFADDGRPVWDETTRTLTLFLGKGRITRLRYSSYAHSDFIDSFGILNWANTSNDLMAIRDLGLLGSHWMVTPFRPLTLVHATQQPVCLPEIVKSSISRPAGAQYVILRSRQIRLHGPSTGKFEVVADWHEWIDDLNQPGPERVHRKGQLGEIQLGENHPNNVHLAAAVAAQNVDPARPKAPADRHELGDTKFRLVRYRLQATTRFREYLPPEMYDQPDLVTRLGPVAEGPAMLEGAPGDAGAPVLPDPAGSTGQSLVPATAPPDDPRVLYVVPTFRWQRNDTTNGADVTRHGNGLRIWIDRPWFSSGDGELLGVVLYGENELFTSIPDKMQSLVTQWGLDPLWDTTNPKQQTRATDFPARVHSETLKLREYPNEPPVEVIGHRVHWDEERGLWYCDIELNPGATYMPFVRLSVVRYQPNALTGQKISSTVLAEFSQVLPRRRAVFAVKNSKVTLKVYGAVPSGGPMKFNLDSPHIGVSFTSDPPDTGRNRFELVLQIRDAAIDSDLAWSDKTVLNTGILGRSDDGFTVIPGLSPGTMFTATAKKAAEKRVVNPRVGRSVKLNAALQRNLGEIGSITSQISTAIWNISADLELPEGQPARLMLREFERYYSDRTVSERRGTTIFQRRFVEERLVYASILDL